VTKTRKPLSDDDVEAYIDGLLEPGRRADVEAGIADDPKMAEMVRAMRHQNEALRLLGDDILDEPIPDRLQAVVDELSGERKAPRKRQSFVLAPPRRLAVLAAMLMGVLANG